MNLKNSFASFLQTLVFIYICFTLTACKKELSVDYLTEHPAVLEKELQYCMSSQLTSSEEFKRCKKAADAQSQISNYLQMEQLDPEKFGQEIIEAEIACAKLKAAFDLAKQATMNLKAENAPAVKIEAAQAKQDAAEKAYLEKKKEVKIMLAVAGLGSPE